MKTVLFLISSTIFLSSAYAAIQLGNISVGGTDCRVDSKNIKDLAVDGEILRIPARMNVRKASGEPLKRASCNFALPMNGIEGKKVVISQLMVPGYVNLSPGTSAQMNLEIFKSGNDGERLVYREQASEGGLSKPVLFEKEEALFESNCGESFILRGNSSLMLSEGLKKSSASMDLIQFKVQVKNCLE